MEKRVLGPEHPATLTGASNLAESLKHQGEHADAERIQREVLGVRRRVLGAEHPSTLKTAANLAQSLTCQGRYGEAEQILQAVLKSFQRVLGPTHPNTLQTASSLEKVRAHIRATRKGSLPSEVVEEGKKKRRNHEEKQTKKRKRKEPFPLAWRGAVILAVLSVCLLLLLIWL
jgi:hypothetical protein